MSTIVITGANRGLGLEFAKAYASSGHSVIASCRSPSTADELHSLGVDVLALDLADPRSVMQFAAQLRGRPIELLIHNAGMPDPSGSGASAATYAPGRMDYDAWAMLFRVHVMAPLQLTEALIDNLSAAATAKVVLISSELGSIAGSRGGRHAYRTSKTAANMLMRSLSIDLKPIITVMLSPGWVATRMGGSDAPLAPDESARGRLNVIAALKSTDSGRFLDYLGRELPW
jgi:NAD(P)-dependent dehydrogenase (short-subunit alcohol dehydrogenase family)